MRVGTDANYQSSGMESNQDAHTTNNGQPRALWIEEGNALDPPKKATCFMTQKTFDRCRHKREFRISNT